MSRLAVFVPSRGRPDNIAALVQSWKETAAGSADLIVAVDEDDLALAQYAALEIWHESWGWTVVGPRKRLGPTLNDLAARYGDYRAVGFMGDDHRPRTPHWDVRVLDALDRLGSGVVYGNDLLQGPLLPTAVFMTSDIPNTLEWMVPPGLIHLFADNAWLALGQGMGRLEYLPEVVIEHLHPTTGKAEMDAGYQEANNSERYAQDGAVFEAWKRDGLPADLAKLRAAGVC